MNIKGAVFCVFIFISLVNGSEVIIKKDKDSYQPQQVHLALGDDSNEIVVTWVTTKATPNAFVDFGTNSSITWRREGHTTQFVDGGKHHRKLWMHRVHLKGLNPHTYYVYRCGSDNGLSNSFNFKTFPSGTEWKFRLAAYGDLGVKNPQSLSRLKHDTENEMYDAILHVGDFAYDMHDNDAKVGDKFMNTIEPIAAFLPYMTCPGNHEATYNFSNYRARFSMPNYGSSESMFYSWNAGPVHFIAVNTEAYYYLNYGIKPLVNLYKWLKKDLEEATKEEVRSNRPWIILYGHRPMYCTNTDNDDCTYEQCILRVGLPVVNWFGMEKLLAKYGVDLTIWAHEHSYERLFPVYNTKVLNGTDPNNPYKNPRGPVHVTVGSAGCKERKDHFQKHVPEWSAFRSSDYGYMRLTVHNRTHINWQQVSDDKKGAIIDEVWLIRDRHEAFSHLL